MYKSLYFMDEAKFDTLVHLLRKLDMRGPYDPTHEESHVAHAMWGTLLEDGMIDLFVGLLEARENWIGTEPYEKMLTALWADDGPCETRIAANFWLQKYDEEKSEWVDDDE